MSENTVFKTSGGIELEIRKISPLLLVRLNVDFPPPKPPQQEVTTPSGKTLMESNPASPEHLEAMREYEQEQMNRTQRLITKRGVVRRELTESEMAQVKDIRDYWYDEFQITLEEDDWLAFINYVAIENQQDLEGLINAVTRTSQPTEGAIGEHADSFRN